MQRDWRGGGVLTQPLGLPPPPLWREKIRKIENEEERETSLYPSPLSALLSLLSAWLAAKLKSLVIKLGDDGSSSAAGRDWWRRGPSLSVCAWRKRRISFWLMCSRARMRSAPSYAGPRGLQHVCFCFGHVTRFNAATRGNALWRKVKPVPETPPTLTEKLNKNQRGWDYRLVLKQFISSQLLQSPKENFYKAGRQNQNSKKIKRKQTLKSGRFTTNLVWKSNPKFSNSTIKGLKLILALLMLNQQSELFLMRTTSLFSSDVTPASVCKPTEKVQQPSCCKPHHKCEKTLQTPKSGNLPYW